MEQTTRTFSALYEQDVDGGYVAYAPALPGCHTQGDTIEEAEANLKEAISLYLDSLRQNNEPLPSPIRILQGSVDVSETV